MKRLGIVLLVLGSPLHGQTLQDRAINQIETLRPVTSVLTTDTLEEVVLPFETASPYEASLGAGDLDAAVLATRVGNSTASQAFQASAASATGRPDVAPSEGALGLANLAVSIGAESVAGLFQSEAGTCTSDFDGPITSGSYTCSAPLSQDFRTCREERRVSVTRSDTWTCSEESPEYRKTCARDITWRCTGTTGNACLKEALQFTREVTWTDAGDAAEIAFAGSGTGACSLREHSLQIAVEDMANLSSLHLEEITYQGVAQLRVNGRNLWTHGTGSGSNLSVKSRDCGKNCAVDAVYAGTTWIEDCGATPRTTLPGIELGPEFTQIAPGPSTPLETVPVSAQSGALSNWVTVSLITANRQETGPSLRFAPRGSCCSEFTATLGDTC